MLIIPTSACTAVVTEIAYNANQGLKAEIEYLTPAEWKEEVDVLLEDIRDPTNSDTTEEVEIARAKVKAVFPSVSLNALEKMTADELLAKNSGTHVAQCNPRLRTSGLGTSPSLMLLLSSLYHSRKHPADRG